LTNTANLRATNNIADADGLAGPVVYQWRSSSNGGATWTDISGATAATYIPSGASVGALLQVAATYSDPFGSTTQTSLETAVVGDANANALTGTAGRDFIVGLGGSDRLVGLAGNDTLDGGSGADVFVGGAGSDTFIGGGADGDTADYSTDAANGGLSGITVNQDAVNAHGGLAPDTAVDGFGDLDSIANVLNITGTQFADQIYGGGHGNTILAGDGNDNIFGNGGADTLRGEGGNDHFVASIGDGTDIYDGGAQTDVYDLSLTNAGANVDLGKGTASSTQTGSDKLASIESVIGSSGNDRINGDDFINRLEGGGGDDRIVGGRGADTLIGGAGNDSINGGQDSDTFVFAANFGKDVVQGFGDVAGNQDVLEFSTSVFADFASVKAAMAQVGPNVVIAAQDGSMVTIENVKISALGADDFHFIA
jgi:Ca2+-binding RTX toxin-like protein